MSLTRYSERRRPFSRPAPVSEMEQGFCRKCHALIFWGRTRAGKLIPLEDAGWAIPNPDGTTLWDELGTQFKGMPVNGRLPGAVRIYRPHFITCPYAAEMRKPRERKKTEWERIQDEKAAAKAAKEAEAAAKKAEKERIAKAAAEFEAQQERLF